MKNIQWKQALPYLGAIAGFVVLALVYFSPQLSGKVLDTHDFKQWYGSAEEGRTHYEETGELALWTNSQFGGMPAYYVFMRYPSNIIRTIKPIFTFGIDRPAGYFIMAMLTSFILGLALRMKPPAAIFLAIAYSFTSYLFVITAAGHFAKTNALSYLPGILAGMILIYRGKAWIGAAVTALFFCLELIAIHPQMTYYFAVFFLVPYVVYEAILQVKDGQLKQFVIRSFIIGGALLIGLLPNASQLWITKEYSTYSTRGKSELTMKGGESTSGLDKSYILNWSNGIGETWSLMMANAKGGASGVIAENKTAMAAVPQRFKPVMSSVDQYWGDQPFTGGPMYSGALVVFLFVLGAFVVRNRLKWVIIGATLITVLLSMGSNLMGLSEFFIDYFPLYNKFRAVVSIQTVAHFCLPLMAALFLSELYQNPKLLQEKWSIPNLKAPYTKHHAMWLAFLFTGGFAFAFWLMPTTFFDFFKDGEMNRYMSQLQGAGWSGGHIDQFLGAVESARVALFKADALKAAVLCALGAGLLWAINKDKLKVGTGILIFAGITLVDLWMVNRTYLNDSNFVAERKRDQPFPKQPANEAILQDKDLDYRVLNLSVSTFNETGTSFFHKSIGGYHGAKMKKYQELIEYQISGEIQQLGSALNNARSMSDLNNALASANVLNALNTKYIIANPGSQPIKNEFANGNAWFVDRVELVPTADEEIERIGNVNLKTTAVVRDIYRDKVGQTSSGQIELIGYEPDHLTYKSSASGDGLVVFSEVYYPVGWEVTIDGEKAQMIPVDYTLRGLQVPAGEHSIEFQFRPSSYYTGEKLALVGSFLMLIVFVGGIVQGLRKEN